MSQMKSVRERLEGKERVIVERIYLRYSKDLFYFAYSLCNDSDQAQDIVNQAFINWIRKAPAIEEEEDIFKYLLTIVKNLAYDYNREKKRYYFFGTEEDYDNAIEGMVDPSSENLVERHGFCTFLKSILTVEEYMILYYRDVYEYDFKKIAEICNQSVRSIRYRYKKIVEKVRKIYAKTYNKVDEDLNNQKEDNQ